MSVDIDACFCKAVALSREAGKLIRENIYKKKKVEEKSCDVDLVTETDQEVERQLVTSLGEAYPDHKFIGEESVAGGKPCELTDSPTWIIDPVDGTMNFVHGYPNVCISLALWINKSPHIGIIYNPVLEQMFTAQKGKGAFLNGNKIGVSSEKELKNALMIIEFGTSRDPEKMKVVINNVTKLTPVVHGVRSSGSAAYNIAMVAMGSAECYFEFGIHIWDIAAGIIIIEEAGGVFLDPSGGPVDPLSRRMLCAGTRELAEELVPHLQQFYPERD